MSIVEQEVWARKSKISLQEKKVLVDYVTKIVTTNR